VNIAIKTTVAFLIVAGFLFPFSVAATNIALGVVLALGLVSGFWWKGARLCWKHYTVLTIIFCVYMALLLLGLLWSLDLEWGLHVLGRHWFWLLIPIVVALLKEEKWRKVFLVSLSSGLALNLVYCVLQMYEFVEVTTDGSSADDATGHIGHIGFGLVYSIWAAWLLHLGLIWTERKRWLAWGLAAWSYIMVFSAQGRSGYLIAVALMLCVLIKWLFDSKNWRIVLPIAAGFILIVLVVVMGPGKERLQGTWLAFTQIEQQEDLNWRDSSDNAILATQSRFQMWQTSIDIWQEHPLLGVGTGGLPQAVVDLNKQYQVSESTITTQTFAHPHNQYLLNLIRWGPLGLLLLLVLLAVWMREGIKSDWRYSFTAPLFTLSGLALTLHALSSSSMEEHFSAILAALLLAVAMSADSNKSVHTGGNHDI